MRHAQLDPHKRRVLGGGDWSMRLNVKSGLGLNKRLVALVVGAAQLYVVPFYRRARPCSRRRPTAAPPQSSRAAPLRLPPALSFAYRPLCCGAPLSGSCHRSLSLSHCRASLANRWVQLTAAARTARGVADLLHGHASRASASTHTHSNTLTARDRAPHQPTVVPVAYERACCAAQVTATEQGVLM